MFGTTKQQYGGKFLFRWKSFKAVIKNGLIEKVGVEYFQDAMAAQPLYKLNKADWRIWLDGIVEFCKEVL